METSKGDGGVLRDAASHRQMEGKAACKGDLEIKSQERAWEERSEYRPDPEAGGERERVAGGSRGGEERAAGEEARG